MLMSGGMYFIVGIMVIPFVFVLIIILIKSVDNRKRMQMKADLYAKAIEKGVELPRDLFEIPKQKHSSLKTGILMISIGIGISVFMFLNESRSGYEIRSAASGLIPFFLGVGFLVVHFVFKKQGIPDEEE